MLEYLLSLSLLIVVVLLIRGIFRKTVSPRAIYALWLVVVLRMLLPITLFEVDVTLPEFMQTEQSEQSEQVPEDSEISADMQEQAPVSTPMQTAPTIPSQSTSPTTPEYPTVITPITPTTPVTPIVPADTTPVTPDSQEPIQDEVITPEEPIPEVPEEPVSINWKRIANLVWFSGAVIASVWVLLTSITYSRRLRKDRVFHRTVRGTKVYVSEYAGVPCIAGLIPSIYITPEAANSKSEILIIIHEHVHIRHGDHIWSIIRALALIVFWWNPLVWAAATVSKQDAELACDDAIASRMNDEGRLKYANILIDTIPQKHRYAVGLGSAPMKERILMLTKKQKNRWISLILAIVLAVSAVGCSFVSLNEKTNNTVVAKFVGIVDTLPDKDPYIAAIGKGGALDYFTFEKGLTFYCRDYSNNCEMQYVLELPDGYTDGNICFAYAGVVSQIGDGVGEIHLLVEAQHDGELKYLDCYFIPEDNFEPGGAIVLSSMKELTVDEANVLRGIENESPSYLEIPSITLTEIDSLPFSKDEALFSASPVGGNPTIMFFDDSLTFYFSNYLPEGNLYEYFTGILTLPEGFTDAKILQVRSGAGSGEIFVSAEAMYNGEKEYLTYGFFGMEAPLGVDVLDDVQTERLMEVLDQANTSVVNVIENSGGLNINTIYLPVGDNYTDAFRFDDRHILYVTWKDSQKNENGLYSKVGVHFYLIDILKGNIAAEAAYNGTFSSYYDDYTDDGLVLYDILYPDDTSGEIQVVDPVKITYINGVLHVEKAQKESQYPRITRRITSPTGKYEVYNISESDGNILHKTSLEVLYADGSVRRLFRNRTLEEVNSLSAVFTYTPMQFVDDTHFVYSLGGYESIKGFGIYDLATDKKIEFDHGAYDFCLAKDGVIIFRENVRNNEGLPEPYRLWSMTIDGEKTLLASLDEADGVMTMPGGMSYRTGEAWISFFNNSMRVLPDYVSSTCVYEIQSLYSLDMSKKLAVIEYPSNGGMRAVRNIHFFEDSVTIVIPVEPTSLEQQYGQGPFIGYVADAETPWIDLYTEKNGTYVGRIPYEIFNGWPATDRDREWWTPGWEPEYMKYYYAEFGAFCWAAVHLGDTVLGSGRKNIATSTDGGKTWNCGSYMDDYGGNHVVGMYFVSDKVAFMSFDPNNEHEFVDGPSISRTIDGGKTWKRLVVSVPDSLKGKKLLAGTPIHEGNVIRYPIRHNPAHGSFEGETMYIISRDNGMTWEWEDTQTVNTVTFTTYSLIPRNTTGSIVSLTLPSAWQWDESYFNEANVRIGVYSDQKRVVVYGALPTLQEFEDTLRESTERVYQMDSPITGRTAAGYAYTGYYGDEEMPKGEMSRQYMFYIATDHGAYRLEVWQRLDFDGENFFEDTVLPIVQSFAIQQTLPHQAIMDNQSMLYDTLSKKEMVLTDWLNNTGYAVSKYTVIDLDSDANLETVLWLTRGSNEYVGFLILHSDAAKTYAHLLYYRQFANLKEDGTFDYSSGVANHGFGEISFSGDAYSLNKIAYCESGDNTTVSYYSERDSRSLTKSEYESWERAQSNKSEPVWYAWGAGEKASVQPVDMSSIGGDWYHSFNYEGWYAFYGLNFRSQTAEMQFDHGLYESEYAHRYSGTYTVDPATQEITAVLHDGRYIHNDPDITIKFTIKVQTEQNNQTLILHILACDVPRYQHLVGQSLVFTREFGYAALQYQDALEFYQMWYEQKLTGEELLGKAAVITNILNEIKTVLGIDLFGVHFTREYHPEEDRFPFQLFFDDANGTKMIEAGIVKYKDEADGLEKFGVEVNPYIIMVE